MKKNTFLVALTLIISTLNAQENQRVESHLVNEWHGPNLVVNSTMDENIDGYTQLNPNPSGGCGPRIASGEGRNGTNGLYIDGTCEAITANDYWRVQIGTNFNGPLTAGTKYVFDFWIKALVAGNVQFEIRGGSDGGGGIRYISPIYVGTDWTEIRIEHIALGTETGVIAFDLNNENHTKYWIDDVLAAEVLEDYYVFNIGYPNAQDVTATLSGIAPNYTLTISGTGAMEDFANGNSMPWYGIKNNIKTLVINSGVTTIGNYAFQGCSGLTGTLTIPNSVTSIGDEVFVNCTGLTGTLTIPTDVTNIGNYAFYGCSGLTGTLTIPYSVTSIGDASFVGCYGLTAINVDVDNPNYSSDNGVLFDKNKTILIQYPAGKADYTYSIPNSVISIEDYAFYTCYGLTSLTIPNSVTTIGNYAFQYCGGLTSLTIPNSVTTIGNYAFHYCSGLTSLTIGNSVTSIGNYAFQYCNSLTGALTIPNSVITIGEGAFNFCRYLTSLIIGNSVTTIGNWAFQYCSSLTSLIFGKSVTSIGDFAFYCCSGLTQVTNLNITPQNIYFNVFENVDLGSATLTVPECALNDYQNAAVWSFFGTIVGDEQLPCGTDNIEAIEAGNIIIYPNPTNYELKITNYELSNENYTIHTISGQVVMQGKLSGETVINVEQLASGVYFIKAGNNTGKFIKK